MLKTILAIALICSITQAQVPEWETCLAEKCQISAKACKNDRNSCNYNGETCYYNCKKDYSCFNQCMMKIGKLNEISLAYCNNLNCKKTSEPVVQEVIEWRDCLVQKCPKVVKACYKNKACNVHGESCIFSCAKAGKCWHSCMRNTLQAQAVELTLCMSSKNCIPSK